MKYLINKLNTITDWNIDHNETKDNIKFEVSHYWDNDKAFGEFTEEVEQLVNSILTK